MFQNTMKEFKNKEPICQIILQDKQKMEKIILREKLREKLKKKLEK